MANVLNVHERRYSGHLRERGDVYADICFDIFSDSKSTHANLHRLQYSEISGHLFWQLLARAYV